MATHTKEKKTKTGHAAGTREQWLAARLELLETEKELVRQSDEVARRRMGWTFPWASSLGSDVNFNFDFNVSFTEEQQRGGAVEYNYRREAAWTARGIGDSLTKRGEGPVAEIAAMTGTDVATYTRERPGMSAFALEDGVVYHAYSAYARGLDGLWGMYQWLDRAPKGRNETGVWWRRHDEYDKR